MPSTARVFHKLKELNKVIDGAAYLTNRNPRNLEKMRIAYKPSGYQLEQPGRNFWHKYFIGSKRMCMLYYLIFYLFRLEVTASGQYVTASVVHYKSGTVLQASTSEWAIKKQLYKTNDTSAYVNLARVWNSSVIKMNFVKP